jgi:hypothetical protein
LNPDQISYACLHSFILIDKDSKSRELKEELFGKLDQYLQKLGTDGSPKPSISRKCA